MDADVNFDLQFDVHVNADLNRTMSEKTHRKGLTPLQLHSNLIPFLDIDENLYEVMNEFEQNSSAEILEFVQAQTEAIVNSSPQFIDIKFDEVETQKQF